jgi:multidrug efflux system membrane fusion protein
VSGFVDSVAFEDGARVKKGQLLFQIDPRPFQAEVNRLDAERNRAVSDLTLAKANYGRAQQLLASNAISREEYERLGAAQSAAEGALGSVDGSLQSARLNLEFTQVRAPIDGHVSRALITAGNLVGSSSLLTTVVSDDPVYAYFDSDEQTYLHYSKLARNQSTSTNEVFMGLVDEDGYPHKGRLDFVDNQVDPSTGTIRARAVFANPDGRYTPGLFARIRLVGGDDRDTVLIEDRAVGTDLGKKFVLVLKPDNSIEYRLVQLGPAIDGLRVVEEGLTPGDVIVVNGLQHVKPGQTVAPTHVAMNVDQSGLKQVAVEAEPTVAAVSAAFVRAQP